MIQNVMTVGDQLIHEGDWISIDGTTGEVFLGKLETMVPDISDPWLMKLLGWADAARRLAVWANADYPAATMARAASACAEPSTCSSSPSGCPSCTR